MSTLLTCLVLFVLIGGTESQTTPRPKTCTAATTCDTCVQSTQCLWCYTNNTCALYPVGHLLPTPADCPLSHARWGVCWVNFEALIIAMAMLAGSLLIGLSACCCWCFCCRRRRSGPDQDEERFARRREEIKQRSEERNVDRKTRHEDIRKKYGLMADSNLPYNKFENE
ncbi:hypothetical protein NHX12_001279 [Muraenolepis orangiensis]|uniref:Pituitary tumor-transforming gene 1 protein-interacting protein-like n=1 Tax=Muraenolepis orangiensis TaxID=630683 RepID=A0A9Q0IET9_9TELE|nr:hypothetical protein NHX12_001279 [Muraenolepis orangiensis]